MFMSKACNPSGAASFAYETHTFSLHALALVLTELPILCVLWIQ